MKRNKIFPAAYLLPLPVSKTNSTQNFFRQKIIHFFEFLLDTEILLWLVNDLPEKVEIPFDELWDYLNDRLYFEVPSNRKELDWMQYVENLKGFIDNVYGNSPYVNRINIQKTLADWVYYRVK